MRRSLTHYFVPGLSNNQKGRLLHPGFLSLLVGAFLIGQFALNSFVFFYPHVLGFASNITPEDIIRYTNTKRAEAGLAPLTQNSVLSQAAAQKAGDMFANNYWAHVSPTGKTPWAFFSQVKYQYLYAGENLARDFNDSISVVDAWMNSPTHRDNIINNLYREIGIAVVDGTLQGVETTLVVQLFGTPVTYQSATASVDDELFSIPLRTPLVGEVGAADTQAEVVPAHLEEEIIPADTQTEAPPMLKVSAFAVTKFMVTLLLGIIVGALILDLYFVSRRQLYRFTGRSLAHLTFLLFVLLSVLITNPGLIL